MSCYYILPTVNVIYRQWGSVVATGLPYPWKFNYPVSLKSTILGISIVRLSGAGAFSEIIQERTLSYLTWIDKDHTNETGGGDAVNFIIIGV